MHRVERMSASRRTVVRSRKGTATLPRRRLDAELVSRGLIATREQARVAISDGRVLVAGSVAVKPDRQVARGEPIVVVGHGPRFVGRGALKLDAALGRFGREVAGLRAIDVGASTGGFTDCLLQRGATEVVAIDVGYGQLHEKLRLDPRVRSLERTNVRDLAAEAVGGPAAIVVVDVSFISLLTVAPALMRLLAPDGDLVALVKPQFEAGRVEASRAKGVLRDPELWHRILGEVRDGLVGLDAVVMDVMASPITGAAGNVEFLLWARRGDAGCDDGALDDAVAAAVRLVEEKARRKQ